MTPSLRAATRAGLGAVHRRRLREVWRSAGWPCQDMVEVELLAAGWLERVRHPSGHETLRVTDAGIAVLAEAVAQHRRALGAHEALVERVACEMARAGRLAWRGLSLRANVDARWVIARPDVFSIRHTTVEDYVEPVVHEVKVRRADLRADLRCAAKRAAYLQLAGECWYVLAEGIAAAEEIPPECGVLVARGAALDVARPAPRRRVRMPLAAWMALARATPVDAPDEAQAWLGACGEEPTGELESVAPEGPAPHEGRAPPEAHAPSVAVGTGRSGPWRPQGSDASEPWPPASPVDRDAGHPPASSPA